MRQTEKKHHVGLFFGSFNPIHVGHMAVANYIVEETELSELWLLPSPMNPLKNSTELLPYNVRCQLISEAIAGDKRIKLNTIERTLPSPHYTILALQALSVLHPDHLFHLIIGADNWSQFDRWYAYSRILLTWPLIIYPRRGHEINEADLPPGSIYLKQAPQIEISSTAIRASYLSNKDYRHWLPNPESWFLLGTLNSK